MFLLHRSNEDIFWPLCSKLETHPERDRVAIKKRCVRHLITTKIGELYFYSDGGQLQKDSNLPINCVRLCVSLSGAPTLILP